MKKLLSILVLSFLFSGSAYAEKIYLKCFYPKDKQLDSLSFDTTTKQVTFRGSLIDRYVLDEDEFKFLFSNREFSYRVNLNRNTGIITMEAWELTKDFKANLANKIKQKIVSENKVNDLDYLVMTIYDEYGKIKRQFNAYTGECEKTDVKF